MTPIRVTAIDHVVIRVADMERALRFYSGLLGCTVERRVEDIGLVQLRAGRNLIDLLEVGGAAATDRPAGRPGNMDHLALRIERFEESELREFLAAHDVAPGEVVERYGAEGNGPSMYISDPEGNTIELKGPPHQAS